MRKYQQKLAARTGTSPTAANRNLGDPGTSAPATYNKKITWNDLTREEQNYLSEGDRCTPLEFMYFNLCPNTKLNQYLLDTAKQTSV